MVTMNLGDILAPENIALSLTGWGDKLRRRCRRTTYEVEVVAKDGRRIPLEVSSRLIYANGEPAAVQGMARDVSDRRLSEETLRRHAPDLEALFQQLSVTHLELAKSQDALEQKSSPTTTRPRGRARRARIDPLTGALNHGGIVEAVRDAIDAGAEMPFAVFMLDIDGMKAANDMFGHPFGDRLLCAVKEALTCDGAVVGRYGGDEFVALLSGAGRTEAEAYQRDALAALASSGLRDPDAGNEVPIEASMGYALFPGDGERIEDLIAFADKAMYAHRRSQPSRQLTSRRMGDRAVVRLIGELAPVLTRMATTAAALASFANAWPSPCGYDGVEPHDQPLADCGRDIAVTYPPWGRILRTPGQEPGRQY